MDYILTDVEGSVCTEHCLIHEDTDLNSSDHLPLSITLSCSIPTQFEKDSDWIRIDWTKAEKSGALLDFQKEVSNRLNIYIQRSRGDIEHIDKEITHVVWLIMDAAQKTLPQLKPKKPRRFKDKTLLNYVQRANKHGVVGAEKADHPAAHFSMLSELFEERFRGKLSFVLLWKREGVYRGGKTSSKTMLISVSAFLKSVENHSVHNYMMEPLSLIRLTCWMCGLNISSALQNHRRKQILLWKNR